MQRTKKKRPNVFRKALGFETLENRSVMAGVTASLTGSVLNITGTAGNDSIILRQAKDKISIDGVTTTFATKSVTSININTGAGDDFVQLNTLNPAGKIYDKAITVNGVSGNDSVRSTNSKDVFFSGTNRKVTIDTKGNTLLDGKALTWTDLNIRDEALRQLVTKDLTDKVLDRKEMLEIFKQTSKDGKVAANEFQDLTAIANTRDLFGTLEYVSVLTRDVVVGNAANKSYAGAALGNLVSGAAGTQLDKLVSKWFLGADHPSTKVGSTTFQYTAAAGTLFGASGPHYTDVNQGYVGDCYYVGALGEIALKNKADIQNMFIVNGDGTYTVRFFNAGKADYVTVDSQLPVTQYGTFVFANMGQRASSTSNILWVALAEKAYVQMNESGWLRANGLPGNGQNCYDAISGGYMSDAIKQVTNRQANNYRIESTGDALATAFNSGKMVGIGTKSTVSNASLVGGHQYVVVGYDSATKKFTLFNPWGVNNGSKPGLVQLTWADIQANFEYSTRSV